MTGGGVGKDGGGRECQQNRIQNQQKQNNRATIMIIIAPIIATIIAIIAAIIVKIITAIIAAITIKIIIVAINRHDCFCDMPQRNGRSERRGWRGEATGLRVSRPPNPSLAHALSHSRTHPHSPAHLLTCSCEEGETSARHTCAGSTNRWTDAHGNSAPDLGLLLVGWLAREQQQQQQRR